VPEQLKHVAARLPLTAATPGELLEPVDDLALVLGEL
jgi:hypothetical protein